MKIQTRYFYLSLPFFLVFWMMYGGALFWSQWIQVSFAASLGLLSFWAGFAWQRGRHSPLLRPVLLIGIAALISLAGNLDILPQSGAWLAVFAFGVLALLAGSHLGEDHLLTGLYWAAWIWLAVWWLPRLGGWIDNRNILGVWPVVSILVILARGRPPWWALPHLGVLLLLGSRGALLGLTAGLVAFYRPRLTRSQVVLFTTVGLAFLYTLAVYRPVEALNRFYYWDQAFQELSNHNIWIGLGPGGVAARHSIAEPTNLPAQPSYFHLHAHNLFVQATAELGLIGLAALILAAVWILRAKIQGRWQIAILVALLVHSLVDLPLYYPGPWLVFMFIAGSTRQAVQLRVRSFRPASRPVGEGQPLAGQGLPFVRSRFDKSHRL
jgi:hypothetical protein